MAGQNQDTAKVSSLKQQLLQNQEKGSDKQQKPEVNEAFASTVQSWMFEDVAPVFMNWICEDFAPVFEEYMKRKAINESAGKTSISFATFAAMKINEAARQEANQNINESQDPENGEIVLDEDEQQVMQQFVKGEKLNQKQQETLQKAQQKLQKQQEKLQESEDPQNGEIVLDEQQKQKEDDPKDSKGDDQKQEDQKQEDAEQQKEQLRESLSTISTKISGAYRRLLEAQDEESQKQVNEEIDQLKEEEVDVQLQLAKLDGNLTESQQEQQMQKAQQKIQDGEDLSEDDLDGLSQSQLEELIQSQKCQQKKQNESAQDYDDPADAKVFEGEGEQKKEDDKVDPLPEDDKEVNESLVGKNGASVIKQSGSLLENLSKRMGLALETADSSKN